MESSVDYSHRYIGQKVHVVIDRPLGSQHPKYGHIYPINYGYVRDTIAPDGEPIDAYVIGPTEPMSEFRGFCIAVIHRNDDDDDKLVVTDDPLLTDEQIISATYFQEKFFSGGIVRN